MSAETLAVVPEVPPDVPPDVVEAEGSMANDCRGHQCSVGELPNILIYSAPNLDMEHWVFLPFLCV